MPKKSGRKRKTGVSISPIAREPNGRASRVGEVESHAPAAIKALLASNLKAVQSQEYGTPVGRMMLEGLITQQQWAAAKRWDRVARDYQNAINAPDPDPRAQEMHAARSHPPDPDSEAGVTQAKRERRAVERFREARDLLLDIHGYQTLKTVREVCEGTGRATEGFVDLTNLRAGLSVLAVGWGLTHI